MNLTEAEREDLLSNNEVQHTYYVDEDGVVQGGPEKPSEGGALRRSQSPLVRRPRGRPVTPESGRQQALSLAAELYEGGMSRKDILGRVIDDLGLPAPSATTYVSSFYRNLKRGGT